jgi:hypothetical protein
MSLCVFVRRFRAQINGEFRCRGRLIASTVDIPQRAICLSRNQTNLNYLDKTKAL